jgi:alpha-L-fucosidase
MEMVVHNIPDTGKDIRFTVKDNTLYAIFLDWPGDEAIINSLRVFEDELSIHWEESELESIHLLGVEDELDWSMTDKALVIKTPQVKPCDHAFAFKIIRK